MNGFIVNLIIQAISGAAGGNALGGILKQFNLGPTGNTIAGAIGGGLGGQVLGAVLNSGVDVGSIISSIVGGGASGAILTLIIGVVRQMMGSR